MNQILCGLLSLLTLFFYVANGEGSAELRRFNMLKFGNTDQDYIMYQPDMSPLASEFTVCAWIRRLNSANRPVWFSYSSSVTSKEIQITDDGYQFFMFGTESDLRSVYTISPGTWFHNCLSWSSATQTRTVYINGRVVDSASTPAGRTLGQGGYLLFGNEQDTYGDYRTDADDSNKFEGEMYKLNVFSRMLTTSEIQELAQNMCVNIEQEYESTRYIKWEDILQLSRNGDVTEKDSSCLLEAYKLLNSELTERLNRTRLELNTTVEELARTRESLHSTEERLNETVIALDRSETRLNETLEELERTKVTHRETEARLNETLEIAENLEEKLNSTLESKCLLNSSITSHWDFLYASPFYGEVLTQQKLQVVRRSLEKLDLFIGVRIGDKIIEIFKFYFS